MATVSYRLEDLKKAIVGIGYVGENDHMHVLIDCKEAFDEYPAAVPTMVIVPPVGDSYPKAVTRNGDVVEWLVKNSDVTVEGDGEFQLTFTEDEVIKKSVNGRFRVKRSISGSGEAPSGVQDWVADANEKLAAVEEATQEAEAAAEHQPKINASGYWEIWDAEQGAYVATTVKAQGDKGDPGDPGSPGDPTELIDDTAGEGVTDKTLSADKLAEKFGDVLTDIDGLKDINKAIVTLFQHTAFTDAEAAAAYNTLYELVYDEPTPTPSPYQKVAYVETDGASRIDTGVQFDGTKNIVVTMEMSFNGTFTYNASILNGWAAGGAVGVYGYGGELPGRWSDGGEVYNADLAHTDVMTTVEMTINAGTNTNTVSSFENTYGQMEKTRAHTNVANRTFLAFPLFAMSKQDSFDYLKSGFRIKSVEIKVGDVIVRSMYACYRKLDNVIGFYDTVNDVFYTNAGTGNFTKGGDIE